MSLMRIDELFGDSLFEWMFRPLGTEMKVHDPARATLEQDNKNYFVRAVVPGFQEEELRVDVSGNRITVSGHKETTSEEKSLHSSSRQSFSASYLLPRDAILDDVNAELKDGILVVSVSKKSGPALESRSVPISSAKALEEAK